MTLIIAILFLVLAVGCRAISELALHGKLKWSDNKKPYGFWGDTSYVRKYKGVPFDLDEAPKTYYYKLFNLKYKERFPGIRNGWHACGTGCISRISRPLP